jgi:hypothetical protein
MNRRGHYLLAVVLSSLLVSPGVATSSGSPKRSSAATTDHSRSVEAHEAKWERDPVLFTAQDRDAIRAYYHRAASNLRIAKLKSNGHHPPNHLLRKGLLSSGLQSQPQAIPNDLEGQLRPLYSGYAHGMIGHDIVIVESRTLQIMDIIRDVAGHR